MLPVRVGQPLHSIPFPKEAKSSFERNVSNYANLYMFDDSSASLDSTVGSLGS